MFLSQHQAGLLYSQKVNEGDPDDNLRSWYWSGYVYGAQGFSITADTKNSFYCSPITKDYWLPGYEDGYADHVSE
jgi:hypothetical protein